MGTYRKYRQEFAVKAKTLAMRGLNNLQIAKALEISQRSFYFWKSTQPDFREAITEAREMHLIDAVNQKLIKLLEGYEETKTVTRSFYNAEGELLNYEVIEEATQKQPSETALIRFRETLLNSNELNLSIKQSTDLPPIIIGRPPTD